MTPNLLGDEALERWRLSGKPLLLRHRHYRLRHSDSGPLKGLPIALKKGQATVVFVKCDEDNSDWVLKRFHNGHKPDSLYICGVSTRLPNHEAFNAGRARIVLTRNDLGPESTSHASPQIREWIDGAVLMPRITGIPWAILADEIRGGSRQLNDDARLKLCTEMIEVVSVMEKHDCAHRDLSSGNVFVDPIDYSVRLIDFDSMFHPGLTMPQKTTLGSEGYMSPSIVSGGRDSIDITWCAVADRFALAVFIIEFLTIDKDAPLGEDGGLFSQAELRRRSGKGVQYATRRLKRRYPSALSQFNQAMSVRRLGDCPSPWMWRNSLSTASVYSAPRLADVPSVGGDGNHATATWRLPQNILEPAFQALEVILRNMASRQARVVKLPPDPWRT